ncbi:hypothetical protein WDZ17_04505 [Pseudokineococcus basanitobsidens]|uniref:Universal stress protein family protein n=1 Tax=Pseudokineococcus basanitobsidens TaxID=1926649 RepID=A0ABU8RHM9_9ACTN
MPQERSQMSQEMSSTTPQPTSRPSEQGVVLLLTEEALDEGDAARITALHEAEGVLADYRVLVPADTERNLLADVVDHLSLFELREALDAVREGQPDGQEARAEAGTALQRSLDVLHAAGAGAQGEVVQDDPLPALEQAVAAGGVREVVVVTRPHAVEDTFHRDWASRAREALGVPVLHVYAGSARLG